MKKAILLFVSIIATTLSNAQTVKGELEGRQTFVVGNNLVVTGQIMNGSKATFKATSYNKDLKIIQEYVKEFPPECKLNGCAVTQLGNLLGVYISTKTKITNKYCLKLTDELKEISFFEVTDSNIKADSLDENHKTFTQFDAFFKYLNTDIIGFDHETNIFSRNKLNKSKTWPTYSPVWNTSFKNFDKIKLSKFSTVDEDIIFGSFIVKEKKKWNDYISRLDAKTGAIQFMVPIKFPSEDEVFFISKIYFDKQNDNLIVAGKLCTASGEKCNEMAILLFDKKGTLLKSQKINLPEYDVKEPGGFNFKNKSINIENIGKLDNGNYFLNISNQARFTGSATPQMVTISDQLIVGFSYYEIDNKLNVISSNFKIAENFDKKNPFSVPTIVYNGISKDGKSIFFTETIKKSKSLRMMDIVSKESKTKELKYVDEFSLGIAFTTEYDMDFFEVYFLDNNLITFQKFKKTNNYEITTMPIK